MEKAPALVSKSAHLASEGPPRPPRGRFHSSAAREAPSAPLAASERAIAEPAHGRGHKHKAPPCTALTVARANRARHQENTYAAALQVLSKPSLGSGPRPAGRHAPSAHTTCCWASAGWAGAASPGCPSAWAGCPSVCGGCCSTGGACCSAGGA